jgi:hypothetical protein
VPESDRASPGAAEQDDWKLLREFGCDLAPGYRPMAAQHLQGWAAHWETRRAGLIGK